jgi:hypothetical protein
MTETIYPIRGLDGRVVAEHVRVDRPDGRKLVFWRVPGRDPRAGLGGLALADLPLYGSEQIPAWTTRRVAILTEGEKARDALVALYPYVLGTVTGASTTPSDVVLASLVPFDVVLWADFDPAGERHMQAIETALARLGVRARLMPRGYDRGDDAADAVARGLDLPPLSRWFSRAQARPGSLFAHRRAPTDPPRPVRMAPRHGDQRDRVEAARDHLLDVVEARLGAPARQRGRSVFWVCPFHSDRTPSFKVDLREPFYRCFGCGARGDVFAFLEAYEGTSFKDSLDRILGPAR